MSHKFYGNNNRVAIFISGGGSTMQALLEEHYQLQVALVVTNKPDCEGVLKAKRWGIPVFIFDKTMSYEYLNSVLLKYNIDRLFLAGFMKIIPKAFVDQWQNRILNIHPSLLPAYKGLHSAERSWADQNAMGVSIHQVIAEMDQGQVLLQKESSGPKMNLNLSESILLLRRTEQHLLRLVSSL